jgi:hypothetical protein
MEASILASRRKARAHPHNEWRSPMRTRDALRAETLEHPQSNTPITYCPPCGPKYGNPWCCRRCPRHVPVYAAGLNGCAIELEPYRQNGVVQHAAAYTDPSITDPIEDEGDDQSPDQSIENVSIRVRDVYNGWSESGGLSAVQMRTIHALLIRQVPLREFAREEGVAAAAISSRIRSLKDKAPEFYKWWAARHAIRRHAAFNRRYAR